MIKTPRTDAAWQKTTGHDARNPATWATSALDMRQECIKLETELTDLKAQFAELVRAEENWRTSSIESGRWKAKELREKAIITLGL
jgi:hypothetical protein